MQLIDSAPISERCFKIQDYPAFPTQPYKEVARREMICSVSTFVL